MGLRSKFERCPVLPPDHRASVSISNGHGKNADTVGAPTVKKPWTDHDSAEHVERS